MTGPPRRALVAVLIALLAAAAFLQVLGHPFVIYDDDLYVTENPHVRKGLTGEGIAWAATATHSSHWHPLTWLSHMADVEIFGLDPRGHHLTSLLLHALNAALLFLLLSRMTGAAWPSAFAAAFFAVHPLRVESVAWVAERKDLLGGLFWILTTGAYLRYVGRPTLRRHLAVVLLFALGLAAKPMLVTLPFALLLLDWWPLGRLGRGAAPPAPSADGSVPGGGPGVLAEKVPLFLLSAASCVVAYAAGAAGGALVELGRIPFAVRAANALVSYADYLWKTAWPAALAVFYPHPDALPPAWRIAGAAALAAGGAAALLRHGKRFPYLPVGLLWFAGTLVPVIGLVQAGSQGMADRYTYIPSIGLAIAVSWGARDLSAGWRFRTPVLACLAAASIAALGAVTQRQLTHWRDSVALFTHAIEVTSNNFVAELNLGAALDKQGKTEEAIGHYRRAIAIRPRYVDAHYNLAVDLDRLGRTGEAAASYREALGYDPRHAFARNNLGFVLYRQGRVDEAVAQYREALRVRPAFPLAHNNLGAALGRLGKIDEAMAHFAEAARLDPGDAMARMNLGLAWRMKGDPEAAVFFLREARRLKPGDPEIARQLEAALGAAGR